MILIFDFGSQSTHLISRRLRELGIETKIFNPEEALEEINRHGPKGIILSGGPASVYDSGSPTIDKKVFDLGIPILGICYGEQLLGHLLEGDVKPGKVKEYGPAVLEVISDSQLFKNTSDQFTVWMSHGDSVLSPPKGFEITAITKTIPCAGIEDTNRKIYGIQFHPEVVHTQFGTEILENFVGICGLKVDKQIINQEFVDNLIKDIKDTIGDRKAICALSGGVDSSVAALLVHKAIGGNLISVYIDSGLMRQHETALLEKVFESHYQMKVQIVDAKKDFLDALKDVTDPEEKRKVIGKTFIEVFEKIAKQKNAKFLVQGTIYPDVIESQGTKHSQKIKSHHNVGGLPEKMEFALVEPLRTFYKDEVRRIGKILGLPEEITQRQPFPGPGLAVRIIGPVTDYNLEILRASDEIVQQEIFNAKLAGKYWQTFAIFTGIKTTGVRGDQRIYGETIAIRAIEAEDAMSADFAKLPWEVLQKISNRIVTEVPEVNRVVYDISTKPPATMEWE